MAVPFQQQMDATRIKCDGCGKILAAKGIRMKTLEMGEWRISYFACPHCGRAYFCGASDEKQRGLKEKRDSLQRKIRAETGKVRQKTLELDQKRLARLWKETEERQNFMKFCGERILGGQEPGEVMEDWKQSAKPILVQEIRERTADSAAEADTDAPEIPAETEVRAATPQSPTATAPLSGEPRGTDAEPFPIEFNTNNSFVIPPQPEEDSDN